MWLDRKEYELNAVLGETARTIHSHCSCVPNCLEVRILLSSQCREGTFHLRVCDLLQKRSENPSCTCWFSSSFSLKYSLCQSATFWDSLSRMLSPVMRRGRQWCRSLWFSHLANIYESLSCSNLGSMCQEYKEHIVLILKSLRNRWGSYKWMDNYQAAF